MYSDWYVTYIIVHWGPAAYIRVGKLGQNLFRQWLVTCLAGAWTVESAIRTIGNLYWYGLSKSRGLMPEHCPSNEYSICDSVFRRVVRWMFPWFIAWSLMNKNQKSNVESPWKIVFGLGTCWAYVHTLYVWWTSYFKWSNCWYEPLFQLTQ